LAIAVAVIAVGHDFTDVGHAWALVLGMLLSTRFGEPQHWTRIRFALLAVGASFGYLVLASTSPLVATAAGVAGATIAACWVRARARRTSARQPDTRAAALEGNACGVP
jgi:CHASE2 domain-containing sensor protein